MSPIHDQSYRHYAGVKRPPGRAWTVIAGVGIRANLSRKFFAALLLVAWIPAIVRIIGVYVVTMYPQTSSIFSLDAKMYRLFLEQQSAWVYFITVFAGAGLIANDRRANALQIYLSKPLLRSEYIGGKLAVIAAFVSFVTIVPSLLILLMQILFSGSVKFLTDNLTLLPSILLGSVLMIAMSSVTMLALSSLSKSARYCGVMYTGVIFFGDAMFGILRVIFDSTRVSWVSIGASMDQVTDLIFREPKLRYETPVGVSILVLLGILVLCASVLERRVRGVEVVS